MLNPNYAVYVKSQHWKKLRRRMFGKFDRCQFCLKKEKLQVHHKYYRKLYDVQWNRDLIVLCQYCHYDLHECKRDFNINTYDISLETLNVWRQQKEMDDEYRMIMGLPV